MPTIVLAVNRFAKTLKQQSISFRRADPEILEVNVGKLCNLTCVQCIVNAGESES
jgi:MoaA/NifB/PqqE/SkfB family radical SAM enzyme